MSPKTLHALPRIDKHELAPEELARAATLPSRFYVDPEFDQFDRQAVFSTNWQYVGGMSQLTQRGDVITAEIAGEPIMVVQTGDNGAAGNLRGFFNVCQHRGGPLVTPEADSSAAGNHRMFRCRYHGWSYKLSGELVGTPKFEGVENFDPAKCSLRPVAVAEWQGLVFASLADRPGELAGGDGIFAGIAERMHPVSISGMKFAKRVIYDIRCNWKVYVDNYMEGYHVGPVHPELSNLLDISQYGFETGKHSFLQHSPLRPGDSVYAKREEGGEAFYWFVHPNIMLNVLPGRLQVNSILPNGHDRTTTIFDYYYEDVTSAAALKRLADDLAYSEVVQQQDIWICEQVQKGLRSRAYDRGRISVAEESGIHFFHERIKAGYRAQLMSS